MPRAASRRELVLAYIQRQPVGRWVTSEEISARMGCTRGAAVKHLRRLYNEGELERSAGFGGTLQYKAKKDG